MDWWDGGTDAACVVVWQEDGEQLDQDGLEEGGKGRGGAEASLLPRREADKVR